MTKVIVVEERRCLTCGACKLECAFAHSEARTLAEAAQSETAIEPRIYVEPMGEHGMPMQCQHCQEAPCITVCPTGALHRDTDDGPVLLDAEHCIVCRLCLIVCPFGVIDVSRTGKSIIKCDLCADRTKAGANPACVDACPTGALQFKDTADFVGDRRRQAAARVAIAAPVADTP
jgi:carbon-monoxide dehydrogenase iron sulfur subunit